MQPVKFMLHVYFHPIQDKSLHRTGSVEYRMQMPSIWTNLKINRLVTSKMGYKGRATIVHAGSKLLHVRVL